jgi:general secretion pathway protein H
MTPLSAAACWDRSGAIAPLAGGKRQYGFTLLEMLLAISIAVLILGVSAPATMRLYESVRYQGAVREVMTMLVSGRYLAITEGEARDVIIDLQKKELKLDKVVKELPGSIELTVVSARELNREGAGVIRFYPDGSSSGGGVQLEDESGRRAQVQVDWLLGKVSLCEADCLASQ